MESANHVDRNVRDADATLVQQFVKECLPEARPKPSQHKVCIYAMTPDEHFIVDKVPGMKSSVFGAGFSGHGFKFASVIGEVLADLALRGKTDKPVTFLSLARLN